RPQRRLLGVGPHPRPHPSRLRRDERHQCPGPALPARGAGPPAGPARSRGGPGPPPHRRRPARCWDGPPPGRQGGAGGAAPALRGVNTVILVSPAMPAQEIAVIDSAVRQGVTHIVKITSKASADSPVDRRRGQARIEAHLATTGLAYTLLRSNAYLQNLFALA